MRNFWIKGKADGRKNPIGFGSKRKDGVTALEVYQKVNGKSKNVLTVKCYRNRKNNLLTTTVTCQANFHKNSSSPLCNQQYIFEVKP